MARKRYRFCLTPGRIALAIGLGTPIFAIALAGIAQAWNVWTTNREVNQWHSTVGTLQSVEHKKSEDPIVDYTYAVQGCQYHGDTFSFARCSTGPYWSFSEFDKLEPKVGQPQALTVYYDPNAPARSCLYRSNKPVWISIFGAIIGVMLFGLPLSVACLLEKTGQTEGDSKG